MKILMVNPWDSNISVYTNGLCKGLAEDNNVRLVGNYYDTYSSETNLTIDKVFFKYSDKIDKDSKLRTIIRGFEYIQGYLYILSLVKDEHFDIIHFQWCLQYDIDIFFLKKIKKYVPRLVFTAHNVIPHKDGKKYISKLKILYDLFDSIIVHGESLKKEFNLYFSEQGKKVIIQNHGDFLNRDINFDIEKIDNNLVQKISSYKRIYLYIGFIFENKGVDRLLEIWANSCFKDDSLLIIAGKKQGEYVAFENRLRQMKGKSNFIYLPGFIEDNTLNYLVSKANIILLPYTHASMSGVIFTAAAFKKTILCTDVGCLSEYLEDTIDSYVTENDVNSIKNKLVAIDLYNSNDELKVMGARLYKNICEKFNWHRIAKKLMLDLNK